MVPLSPKQIVKKIDKIESRDEVPPDIVPVKSLVEPDWRLNELARVNSHELRK